MKKLFISFVAVVVAAVMTTTVFTSCSKSDDTSDSAVKTSYTASGNLGASTTASVSFPESWGMVGPMNDYYNVVANATSDAQLKQACDEVYNKHMKMTDFIFFGKIEVYKVVTGKTQETIWSKEY